MYLAIREPLFEIFDDLPAIDKGLQLGGRTKIAKKIAALTDRAQALHGFEKGILSLLSASDGIFAVGLQVTISRTESVLMY